jgi:hypothetical protein
VVDYKTTTGINFHMAYLMDLYREWAGVGENTFLLNRECYILGYFESIYIMFELELHDLGYM